MSAATGASAIEKNEASAEAQEENLTEVVDRYSPREANRPPFAVAYACQCPD